MTGFNPEKASSNLLEAFDNVVAGTATTEERARVAAAVNLPVQYLNVALTVHQARTGTLSSYDKIRLAKIRDNFVRRSEEEERRQREQGQSKWEKYLISIMVELEEELLIHTADKKPSESVATLLVNSLRQMAKRRQYSQVNDPTDVWWKLVNAARSGSDSGSETKGSTTVAEIPQGPEFLPPLESEFLKLLTHKSQALLDSCRSSDIDNPQLKREEIFLAKLKGLTNQEIAKTPHLPIEHVEFQSKWVDRALKDLEADSIEEQVP